MAKPAKKISEEELAAGMSAVNTLAWVLLNKIKFSEGMPFDMVGHQYQVEPLQCNALRQCTMKGAQLGETAKWILKVMHGLIQEVYKQGAMYLFPTGDDALDFTKARFDPLIASNPCIAQYVRTTDNASIKKIKNAMLYLRGARSTHKIGGESGKKSSTKLKTAPVDIVVFDECDEMDPAMIQMGRKRLLHSEVKQEAYLSTPTIPGHGISMMYDSSDQRVWMIKCQKCNHETCLEKEFPECLGERRFRNSDKINIFRKCGKCGEEIYTVHGRWVASYPDRAEEMVGWWISSLNSHYVTPAEIMKEYKNPPNGDLAEVYNSFLGMPWVNTENRLTVDQVHDCCKADAMAENNEGPACMGVDIDSTLHYVIAVKPGGSRLKVIKIGKIVPVVDEDPFSRLVVNEDPFSRLHDIAQDFGVKCIVMDKYPETNKVRDFQRHERRRQVFLCGYQDGKQKGPTSWNEKIGEIQGNRTELLDASHELVAHSGTLELPRRSDTIEQYAKQMVNIAKVLHEDMNTGDKTYKYIKVGTKADHYRHATNYCMLASEVIGFQRTSKYVRGYNATRKNKWAGTTSGMTA